MILSIEDYDRAEYEATATASYPALRAFCPVYFLNHGVPTNVTREIELMRYVDMMGEVWAFDGWDRARFSDPEADHIFAMQQRVSTLTQQLFGRSIIPISNVLSPWPILRVVRHLAAKLGRRLNIFEGAAGCGYLGAYLIADEHDYTGFDITQGLYLWQNRLWSALTPNFWEGATELQPREWQAVHMPWWLFGRYHHGNPGGEFDIVICDSALGEMSWFGYRYFISAARRMIEHSEVGCLLMTSVGDPKNQIEANVIRDLVKLGLHLHRVGGVMAFVTDRFPHKMFADFPQPHGRRLSEFFKPPEPLPDNYAFMKFAGLA